MTCPHCWGAEKIFDQGTAERELKAYRAHGPGTTTVMQRPTDQHKIGWLTNRRELSSRAPATQPLRDN